MMKFKKAVIISIFFMTAVFQLSAAVTTRTKSFRLQGGYDAVVAVDITGIAAQQMQGLVGMPFDITDKSVLSSNRGDGREIAKWSMLSNVPFLVKIDVTSMHNEDLLEGQWNDSNSLNYVMTFDYKLVYDKDGISSTKRSTITIDTGSKSQNPAYDGYPKDIDGSRYKTSFCFDIFDGVSVADAGSFVGSLDGSIYFKFDDDSSVRVFDDTAIPGGNYSATVKITLETNE